MMIAKDNAWKGLHVGCGIGVGSVFIGKRYGCQVVGLDISEKWSGNTGSVKAARTDPPLSFSK
ncbi:class I SAM-dependent methyltransferase [candidate division KSB1 bacterium]|nr:class I SAM-dependent methyltransferase [bacterium]NUM65927.1 class I SAM-dependent methyltransferase [candidate division KSB1 bacterium]